jgi:CheY-like chemotaxis protein
MPLMDGAATARALREITPGVRIVAVSGLGADDGVGEKAESLPDVAAFLTKPYTAGQLLAALRSSLQRPK